MDAMSQDKDEVRRLLGVLQTLMRMLAVSNREIERRMGLNHGTIGRILGGQIEARLEVVLGMVRALGLGYEEFFVLAYPERLSGALESPAALKIDAMLEDLRPLRVKLAHPERAPAAAPVPAPAGAGPLDRAELVEDLKKAVLDILSETGSAYKAGPKAGNGGDPADPSK